ncbi:MAG: BTAD domain-containing putative transcriptional regulator [Umezawaea sp.]
MVRFRLLGAVEVHDDTGVRPIGSAKGRLLLAALLMRANRTVSLDLLRTALWEDSPPVTADASLTNHVARLRRVLDPTGADRDRLVAVPNGYRLRVAPDELDVLAFDVHLTAARQAHRCGEWKVVAEETTHALALWLGPPLADLPRFAEAPEQAQRVEQLTQARLEMLEWRFDGALATGRHHGLTAELTALAADHPLREVFHRQLIVALHRADRQAEALAVFQRLRRTLVDELGIEPGSAVREAHQEVLTGRSWCETPVKVDRSCQLPADVSHFVGRDEEASVVRALVRASDGASRGMDGARLVVLSGMGGIGKTALAVHVAHQVGDDFPDGQLYADLRGLETTGAREPHDLLARFLVDLGVPADAIPAHIDDRSARFRAVLTERRVLLVLDNARDAGQVRPLLPGGGASAAVITSRQVLADLPSAYHLRLPPLDVEPQRTLLAALCGSRRVDGEPAAAAAVLAACGGLPLALRIVGARMVSRPAWPLVAMAERLAHGRLAALAVGDLAVRATFAMSYRAMRESDRVTDRDAADAFCLLGLWPGHTLTTDSASALLDLPAVDAGELLETLVDAHLLQSPRSGRYAFHDLLGEYAATCAAEDLTSEARTVAVVRLLVWYAAATAAASLVMGRETRPPEALEGPPTARLPDLANSEQALAWCVRELPAIKHAITEAGAHHRSDLALRLAMGLFGYTRIYWAPAEWDQCLLEAITVAQSQHLTSDRRDLCVANLRAALALVEESGDTATQAMLLGNLSALHVRMGMEEDARQYAARSQELTRRGAALPVDLPS